MSKRSRQHTCAAETRSGRPCQRAALLEPDEDGEHRCYIHTLDLDHAEKRRRTDAASRIAGAAGKRHELELRRADDARRRAEGLPSHAATESYARAREVTPDVLEPATLAEQMGDYDLSTKPGRKDFLHRLADLVLKGQVSPREAEALVKVVHRCEAQASSDDDNRRTVAVRFAVIETRDQAEAYREAQLIREGG